MTQSQALSILKTGANVFLTGEPGSGKSHTVNAYVQYLRAHDIEPAITASTGIAATHIAGVTIHSWSGIGIRRSLTDYDLDHISSTEYLARRIKRTHVMIIDEISMIDAATLDMVDIICREIRHNSEAFGGMQVVVVGDFFQLPPVSQSTGASHFAFAGEAWARMKPVVCYLSEQHRQADNTFLSVLSAIRANNYDEMHHEHISTRLVDESAALPLSATLTRLFPHNANVDRINELELAKLSGKKISFPMTDKGSATLVSSLKKGCLSPEVLELKVGAVVMCTKNNREKNYANGTLGTVTGFGMYNYPTIKTRDGRTITMEPADWIIEDGGKIKASINQIPLRLAWAITIHKSQGMSLDAALMDLRDVFEYGQGYVALSRVRTLDGLYLLGVSPQTFKVHPMILEEDRRFQSQSRSAEAMFEAMDIIDLQQMHDNFIKAVGGTLAVRTGTAKKGKVDTMDKTRVLVLEGKTIAAIAKARAMTWGTIMGHIEKLVETKRLSKHEIKHLIDVSVYEALPDIDAAFIACDTTSLAPVREYLGDIYSYDVLRLARLALAFKTRN